MSEKSTKPRKSDRITQLVNQVDGMRVANPYMDVLAACQQVGLSRDTYYLRKRKQSSLQTQESPGCNQGSSSSTTEATDCVLSVTKQIVTQVQTASPTN
jgi:hypothetical protein